MSVAVHSINTLVVLRVILLCSPERTIHLIMKIGQGESLLLMIGGRERIILFESNMTGYTGLD